MENEGVIIGEILPKQRDFILAEERELLYSGAFGAGKSRALVIKLISRALHPGMREGLCRKTLVSLKSSTLKTLLEPDGDLPPVLLPWQYTHNKSEHIIKIIGGGEIQYFGLDDPSKIGSFNLSGCAIDEAVDLTEDDYTMLRGRIRVRVKGQRNQLYGACNPGAPSHFLAQRFGLSLDHKCEKNCRAIMTKTSDNVFLPKDYIENLNQLTGVAFKRYVLGQWAGAEGIVYDRWDREVHIVQKPLDTQWSRMLVCQDDGYTNPAVMLLLGEDSDGRIHIISEWYKSKQLEAQVIEYARSVDAQYSPDAFVIDPSAKKLIEAMRNEGLSVIEANNDVLYGIRAVQGRLNVQGDGLPRLTVSPDCENTIREFESYEWMKERDGQSKDKPKKQFDHAMDALRYGIMYANEFGADMGAMSF